MKKVREEMEKISRAGRGWAGFTAEWAKSNYQPMYLHYMYAHY